MLPEINNIYIFVPVLNYWRIKWSKQRNITFDDQYCLKKKQMEMQTKSLLPKSPNCIKNTYTVSTFGMYFVFKFNMIGENTPIKLIYSPYSHQIWTSSEKFICTYSFFKVQNKETKNKQPLTAKHHLALWPRPLSDTAQQCMEGWCPCRPPLPSHPQHRGNVFEGTWSTLSASCLYLEGYFSWISHDVFFFFPTGSPNQGPGEKARSS